jgi:hypothetical protein
MVRAIAWGMKTTKKNSVESVGLGYETAQARIGTVALQFTIDAGVPAFTAALDSKSGEPVEATESMIASAKRAVRAAVARRTATRLS